MESWKNLLGRDLEPRSIYFVCTGNICRSAFAEHFCRHYVTGTTIPFASAGVGALVGSGMDPTMRQVAAECGIDGSEHVSRQLTGRMLKEAALVIVFDTYQVEWITSEFPEYLGRSYMIGHLARVLADLPEGVRVKVSDLDALVRATPVDPVRDCVSDPYGGGIESAHQAAREIMRALTVIAPRLF